MDKGKNEMRNYVKKGSWFIVRPISLVYVAQLFKILSFYEFFELLVESMNLTKL